jgi:hypothetical protein
MFELLVPPEKAQLDKLKADKKAYDLELRPGLMVETIQQLQDAHVEPDVQMVEGLAARIARKLWLLAESARRYREFVDVFESARVGTSV